MYVCACVYVYTCVKLPKNIPLKERDQVAGLHFTNEVLKSSSVLTFLSYSQSFSALPKTTHLRLLLPLVFCSSKTSKQPHRGSIKLLNQKTALMTG